MIYTPKKILIAGAKDKADALNDLAVQLYITDTGRDAIRCLKKTRINAVISRWELLDIKGGEFLKAVKEAKPDVATIAIIKPGNYVQEVAARSIGISAVLPEDIDDGHFRSAVCLLTNVYDGSNDYVPNYETSNHYLVINNT